MNTLIHRFLHRGLPLALALGVLVFLRWSGVGVAATGPESTTVAIGFMLIAAFVAGTLAARLGLPRITGYLVTGLLSGPFVSGLLTADMLSASKAIEGLATALIALTAGGEIRLEWVRHQLKRVSIITFTELGVVGASVLVTVMAARPLLPFMPTDELARAAVMALVLGTIAVSSSPLVTIAVIAENRASGPLSRTVLGVTILKDVCVIVLFAVVLTVARNTLGGGIEGSVALTLLRELGGSVVAGIGCGFGIALFLRFVARDTPVFVLAVCLMIWQLSSTFQLEALLVALTAGFWVENFSVAEGSDLIKAIERVSLPVYALFFAAAGAKVDLHALATLWPVALLLCGVRSLGVFVGATAGARLAGVDPGVTRRLWLGLISQAGVTLALATIVARTFPNWGSQVQALVVAMIAIHELVGPIAFQAALRRAGETGRQPDVGPIAPTRVPSVAPVSGRKGPALSTAPPKPFMDVD